MQATHFDETDTILEHFNMLYMYPCAECGNMDADPSVHGGYLSEAYACGIGDEYVSAPTGSNRQNTDLGELHHSITAYMDIRTIKGRPGAANVVSSLRELLMRTKWYAHTHGGPGIMKHVFTKVSLAHLIRFISMSTCTSRQGFHATKPTMTT